MDAIGTLRLLEAIRFLGMENNRILPGIYVRALCGRDPQKETTPFHPRRTYRKMYAYWIVFTVNLTVCTHVTVFYSTESPRRDVETFWCSRLPAAIANIALLKV